MRGIQITKLKMGSKRGSPYNHDEPVPFVVPFFHHLMELSSSDFALSGRPLLLILTHIFRIWHCF